MILPTVAYCQWNGEIRPKPDILSIQKNWELRILTEIEFLYELGRCALNDSKFEHLGVFDWIEPKRYRIGGGIGSAIEARLGVLTGNSVQQFEVIIYLPQEIRELDEVIWSELLPTANFDKLCNLNGNTFEIDCSQ